MSHRNIFYYDEADNVTCVRDPDLGLTYYEYDLLDRVTSVKNPFGEVTYYEYTPGGQVKQKILGNAAVSYYEYDAARRVSRIEHRTSDLTEIATLDYEYDRVGNPTKITETGPLSPEDGSATYYSYDHIYQLTGETQVDSGGGVEYAFEYDYDGAHNRTVKVVDGTPTYYSYNEANQLLTETTGEHTVYYHYDGCGNTVARQEAAGTTYYHYDTENLITRIDFPAGGHSYYSYDADSKRVDQRTAEGFRRFVYQGPDMLALQMERDESEETVAHYTMGSGLEAMRRDSASSFYHFNHLGTTLALTGADEAVSDTYRHEAWGVLLERTGSTVNPHTYVGRERYYRMPNAAMYHLGFRDYAHALGRFVTVDPVRRYWEHQAYAANNPTRRLDPRGLQSWIPGEGPNPEERDGRQLPRPGGWPWTPKLPPPGPYEIPPRVDPLPVTCGGEHLPRALPVFPGLGPSGPGTGERDFPIGVQPIDWDWIAPWVPSDPNHPFHECMAKRSMSAQSPCWAHYIRDKVWDLFPDVDTGQEWRYTLERCLCEDACVCASRTCVRTPPDECENVKKKYDKPPGLGEDQFPWPGVE